MKEIPAHHVARIAGNSMNVEDLVAALHQRGHETTKVLFFDEKSGTTYVLKALTVVGTAETDVIVIQGYSA